MTTFLRRYLLDDYYAALHAVAITSTLILRIMGSVYEENSLHLKYARYVNLPYSALRPLFYKRVCKGLSFRF